MSVLGKLIKLIEKLKKRVKYKTVDKRKLLKVKVELQKNIKILI